MEATQLNTDKKWTEITVEEVQAPKDKMGWTIEGQFVEVQKVKSDEKALENGEIIPAKESARLIMIVDGLKKSYFADIGMQKQIRLTGLKEGQTVRFQNMGKKQNGFKTENIWKVFKA